MVSNRTITGPEELRQNLDKVPDEDSSGSSVFVGYSKYRGIVRNLWLQSTCLGGKTLALTLAEYRTDNKPKMYKPRVKGSQNSSPSLLSSVCTFSFSFSGLLVSSFISVATVTLALSGSPFHQQKFCLPVKKIKYFFSPDGDEVSKSGGVCSNEVACRGRGFFGAIWAPSSECRKKNSPGAPPHSGKPWRHLKG